MSTFGRTGKGKGERGKGNVSPSPSPVSDGEDVIMLIRLRNGGFGSTSDFIHGACCLRPSIEPFTPFHTAAAVNANAPPVQTVCVVELAHKTPPLDAVPALKLTSSLVTFNCWYCCPLRVGMLDESPPPLPPPPRPPHSIVRANFNLRDLYYVTV